MFLRLISRSFAVSKTCGRAASIENMKVKGKLDMRFCATISSES